MWQSKKPTMKPNDATYDPITKEERIAFYTQEINEITVVLNDFAKRVQPRKHDDYIERLLLRTRILYEHELAKLLEEQ